MCVQMKRSRGRANTAEKASSRSSTVVPSLLPVFENRFGSARRRPSRLGKYLAMEKRPAQVQLLPGSRWRRLGKSEGSFVEQR